MILILNTNLEPNWIVKFLSPNLESYPQAYKEPVEKPGSPQTPSDALRSIGPPFGHCHPRDPLAGP